METTTNKTLTLDWSILADQRRSSDWLIGDEPPEPNQTRRMRVLLSVLDANLRFALAQALRLDGHQGIEAEDPVSPQRYLDGIQPDAAVDMVICGTSVCERDSSNRDVCSLIMLGRERRAGAVNTLLPLSGKLPLGNAVEFAQLRQLVLQQQRIS